MAMRTLQDQVKSVLGRTVAEAKTRGLTNAPIEAAALFESIAFTLLLHPRAALYFMLLARNGLSTAVSAEMAAVDVLIQTILDLTNTAYVVDDLTSLQQAKTALLQMERSDKILPTSPVFKRFDANVSDFLKTQIGPNVKKPGSTSLLRPASEAKHDFPTDFSSLKDLHQDLLDRLYALVVGVDNFIASPISTILGITTATRARVDIEQMISGSDSSNARDMAITLIANRAALKIIGSAPSPFDPVLSGNVPQGYSLKLRSDPASASVVGSSASGFVFSLGASINISTPTVTRAASFPQTTSDLKNQGHLVSAAVSYPIVVPAANYFLFITFTKADGSTISYKVPLTPDELGLFDGTVLFTSPSVIVNAINSVIGSDGTAAEYIAPGSSRIIIWANAPNVSLTVDPSFTDPNFFGTGVVGVLTNSGYSLPGFTAGQQSSVLGSTPLSTVLDALSIYWGDLFSVGPGLTITGTDTSIGTYLSLTGDAAILIGLSGIAKAKTATARLYGSVNGLQTDPVDPTTLLQIGDQVSISTGISLVNGLSPTRITLSDKLPTFDEAPTVSSSVVVAWQLLIASVKSFLPGWVTSGYQKSLTLIDRALSPLNALPGPAQINTAVASLTDLKSKLLVLQALLADTSTLLPNSAAAEEKQIVAGIVASLEERKFDRAVDLFLRGKLQEALGVDNETASFSGNFLKTAGDVAQNDFKTVNRSQDEGLNATTLTTRTP